MSFNFWKIFTPGHASIYERGRFKPTSDVSTASLLEGIKRKHPLGKRMACLKELINYFSNCEVSSAVVRIAIDEVSDLLVIEGAPEKRIMVFKLISITATNQFHYNMVTRNRIFMLLEEHPYPEDYLPCLEALYAITQGGRHIESFESHILLLLLKWIDSFPYIIPAHKRKLLQQSESTSTLHFNSNEVLSDKDDARNCSILNDISRKHVYIDSSLFMDDLFIKGLAYFKLKMDSEVIVYLEKMILYLGDLIKYNSLNLKDDTLSVLVQRVCKLCNSTTNTTIISVSLYVLDIYVRYGLFDMRCHLAVTKTLCRCVNLEEFCSSSWQIMKAILQSFVGYQTISVLCEIINSKDNKEKWDLVRGTIFMLTMSCWGSQKVISLNQSFLSVLICLKNCIPFTCPVVGYEILLSLDRLIRHYSQHLGNVEWSVCMGILMNMAKYTNQANERVFLDETLDNCLNNLEELFMENKYNGPLIGIVKLFETYGKRRSEKSLIFWLKYKLAFIGPANQDYMINIRRFMQVYFIDEERPAIRNKCLGMVSGVAINNAYTTEQYVLHNLLLEVLADIAHPKYSTSTKCLAISIFDSILSASKDPQQIQVSLVLLRNLCYLSAETTTPYAINVLVSVFTRFSYSENGSLHVNFVLHILLSILSHYYQSYDPVNGNYNSIHMITAKKSIYQCLLAVRCNQEGYVYFTDAFLSHLDEISNDINETTSYEKPKENSSTNQSNNDDGVFSIKHRLAYSIYLKIGLQTMSRPIPYQDINCESIDMFVKDYLIYNSTIEGIVKCIDFETCPDLLINLFTWLREMLVNINLITKSGIDISTLTSVLSQHIIDHSFTNRMRNYNIRGGSNAGSSTSNSSSITPIRLMPPNHKILSRSNSSSVNSDSELYTCAYFTLTALIGYKHQLSRSLHDKLIYCFIKGLSFKHIDVTRPSIITLILCLFELQRPMLRWIPGILSEIAKISCNKDLSIPILEFLSALVRIPIMYENFTDADYKIIFRVLMPYTDGKKYELYIVSLSFHVISVWYLKCDIKKRAVLHNYVKTGIIRPEKNEPSESAEAVPSGGTIVSEYYYTCKDMLEFYAYASFNPNHQRSETSTLLLKDATSISWIYKRSLFTFNISNNGWSELVIRKSVGTVSWLMRLQNYETNNSLTVLKESLQPAFNFVSNDLSIDDSNVINNNDDFINSDDDLINRRVVGQDRFSLPITPIGSAPMIMKSKSQPELSFFSSQRVTIESQLEITNTTKDDITIMSSADNDDEFVLVEQIFNNKNNINTEQPVEVREPIQVHTIINSPSIDIIKGLDPVATDGFFNAAPHVYKKANKVMNGKEDDLLGKYSVHSRLNMNETVKSDIEAIIKGITRTNDACSSIKPQNDELITHNNGVKIPDSSDILFDLSLSRSGFNIHQVFKNSIEPMFFIQNLGINNHINQRMDKNKVYMVNDSRSDAFIRAVKLLDLAPSKDTHKIGILYVSGLEKTEREVFNNQACSPRYIQFLDNIGRIVPLKNFTKYTAGLDRIDNFDGEFSIYWEDDITEVMFHVATLMPMECDFLQKKRHIGNDYVIIIYHDNVQEEYNGSEYDMSCEIKEEGLGAGKHIDMSIFTGEFYFVKIIIQPLKQGINRVTVIPKIDMVPYLFERFDYIVSNAALGGFIRQLSIHANLSSKIQQQKDSHSTNWISRLRQINRIKGRMT